MILFIFYFFVRFASRFWLHRCRSISMGMQPYTCDDFLFFPFQLKFGRLHFQREKRSNAILYASALHRIGSFGALCCCYGLRVHHSLERYLHFSVFSPKCEQARAIPLSMCVFVCVYLVLFSSWVLQLKRHLSIRYSLVFSLWCGKCLPVDFSYFYDGYIRFSLCFSQSLRFCVHREYPGPCQR